MSTAGGSDSFISDKEGMFLFPEAKRICGCSLLVKVIGVRRCIQWSSCVFLWRDSASGIGRRSAENNGNIVKYLWESSIHGLKWAVNHMYSSAILIFWLITSPLGFLITLLKLCLPTVQFLISPFPKSYLCIIFSAKNTIIHLHGYIGNLRPDSSQVRREPWSDGISSCRSDGISPCPRLLFSSSESGLIFILAFPLNLLSFQYSKRSLQTTHVDDMLLLHVV